MRRLRAGRAHRHLEEDAALASWRPRARRRIKRDVLPALQPRRRHPANRPLTPVRMSNCKVNYRYTARTASRSQDPLAVPEVEHKHMSPTSHGTRRGQ
eukprot:4974636-Pyramimonas_sp.AAC.2